MSQQGLLRITLFVLFSSLLPSLAHAEKLNSMVGYSLNNNILPRLEKAERLLEQGDKHSAQSYFDTALQEWQVIHRDFKGKFDIQHPDIAAAQKRLDAIAARLKPSAKQPAPAPAPAPAATPGGPQAPPSAMIYTMKQLAGTLDKAQQYLQAGNPQQARANLDSAEQQWSSQKEWNKGKYDPQHEDVVALEDRFAQIRAAIASASAPASARTATASQAPSTSGQGAPTAAMQYSMKQIDRSLDGCQQDIEGQRLDRARDSFSDATQYWEAFKKDYRGKYDPQHPDIVALSTKYAHVKANLERLSGESAQAAADLPAVLSAITAHSDALQKAYDEAYAGLRDLSSLVSDGNTEKLRLEMTKVRPMVDRIYDLLPDAMASAQDFRAQFPDFSTLGNLVKDGRAAGEKVERLEGFPARWLDASGYFSKEILREAQSNIQNYGLGRLGDLAGKDESLQSYAADSAETHVIASSSTLLDLVEVIYPELSPETQALVPEIAKARQDAMERVTGMRADIAKVTEAVRKVRKDVQDARQRQLAQARFPKSEYRGGEWKDAEQMIHTAWSEAIPDKKLIRIAIYRPWEVIEEARWNTDHWVFNTYRYIGANCLAQLPDGKYRVYRMNFRNTKLGNGWSKLKHWSVGHSYEILKENIYK